MNIGRSGDELDELCEKIIVVITVRRLAGVVDKILLLLLGYYLLACCWERMLHCGITALTVRIWAIIIAVYSAVQL